MLTREGGREGANKFGFRVSWETIVNAAAYQSISERPDLYPIFLYTRLPTLHCFPRVLTASALALLAHIHLV